MSTQQTSLLEIPAFTEVRYSIERNKGEQNNKQLNENREHYESQAMWVREQLLKGRKLNGDNVWEEKRIRDLNARIFALKKSVKNPNGLNISDEKIPGGKGMKNFFLSEEEIKRVNAL